MAKISKSVLIPVVGLVLFAAIAAGAYYWMPAQFRPMKVMKADAAAKKAVDYVNKNMLAQGTTASYKEVKSENGMYTFKLTVQGKDYSAYVTKDGALFFAEGIPQAIPLDKSLDSASGKASASVTKSDKPDVKLFVMAYCPYGLQAEKMYLPVYNLLKDKATMGVYFVNYAMHGKREIDENLRQYCIQKDQDNKYAAYLQCFVDSASPSGDAAANYSSCLTKAGIDQTKLSSCVASTDKQFNITKNFNDKSTWLSGQFPKFTVNDDLNTKYNVQGSPTIVINDKDVSESLTTRSPEALKALICSAFNNQPAECKTKLSADQPSTGFGAGTAAAGAAAGGCATN
jgi:protein-disulfide isomerase